MLKRMFQSSSPWGFALTVAGVVLLLSPEARKSARRLLVKGTAAVLGVMEQEPVAEPHSSDHPE